MFAGLGKLNKNDRSSDSCAWSSVNLWHKSIFALSWGTTKCLQNNLEQNFLPVNQFQSSV